MMNDKIKNTVSNISDKVKDGAEKIANSDTVSNAVDKLNENEYVKKVKSNKNYKYIKLGAVVVAVLLVIGVFNLLFGGDKYSKKAVKAVKNDIVTYGGLAGLSSFKIDTDVVEANKKLHLYIIDSEYTCKNGAGEKVEEAYIYIVYSDKDKSEVLESYPYGDDIGRKEFIRTAKSQLEKYSK